LAGRGVEPAELAGALRGVPDRAVRRGGDVVGTLAGRDGELLVRGRGGWVGDFGAAVGIGGLERERDGWRWRRRGRRRRACEGRRRRRDRGRRRRGGWRRDGRLRGRRRRGGGEGRRRGGRRRGR